MVVHFHSKQNQVILGDIKMKRPHFFAVSVIIVLSVPQIGNSSVSATKLKRWGELISSLDTYFIQPSDILTKKNQECLAGNRASLSLSRKPQL